MGRGSFIVGGVREDYPGLGHGGGRALKSKPTGTRADALQLN